MSAPFATLMLASCQYPPDLLREIPAYRSLSRMRARLRRLALEQPAASRVLWMAGDTIYVDPTAGLFDPEQPEDRFEAPYWFLKGRIWQRLTEQLDDTFCLADDHEYEENWEPSARARINTGLQRSLFFGKRAHLRHMRGMHDIGDQQVLSTRLWGEREPIGGRLPCFVLDLRSERERRDASNIATAGMCSAEQMDAFKTWLQHLAALERADPDRPPTPKLVLSASTLLPRRLQVAEDPSVAAALNSDACDGYPAFLAQVFGSIVEHGVRGLLFLSGDEHLSFVTRAELGAPGYAPVVIHSVHASPLYGPYPFANGQSESFAEIDHFKTLGADGLPAVRVCASTRFVETGNGFCELSFESAGNPGAVDLRFSGETGTVRVGIQLDR